jgi:hypothetical protein
MAVLVDRRAADHRQDGVASGLGVRQALEHHHAAAFAAHKAIGAGIEGFAAPIGGHHSHARGRHGEVGREHHIHAAGQGGVAFAIAQALYRQMHRHQR